MTTEVLIDSICPNCSTAFHPDLIFGNLRRCKACKQWSVALANSNINENVTFRTIHFEIDTEQLKKILYDSLYNESSIRFLKEINGFTIEKLLIPVREIGSGGSRQIISLNTHYSDFITDILKRASSQDKKKQLPENGVFYDEIIPRDKHKKFTEADVRDKTIVTEDIEISKESIDYEYDILRDEYYRVLYIPVYRIHLEGVDRTWSCLGLEGAPGLKSYMTFLQEDLKKEKESKNDSIMIIGLIGVVFGIFLGFKSCSATIDQQGEIVFLFIMGLFSLIWRTLAGWIIGYGTGNIITFLLVRYKRKSQLRRIFNKK